MLISPVIQGPLTLQIGPIAFSWYGILVFIGVLITVNYLGIYRAHQTSTWSEETLFSLFDYILVASILGGRIGDIVFYHLPETMADILYLANQPSYLLLTIGLSLVIVGYSAQWFIPKQWFFMSANILVHLMVPIVLVSTTHWGGMSFHGGLIGTLLGTLFYSYRSERHFTEILDFLAPLAPPILGIGRIANFINGELWGRPTTMPWGVIFLRADIQPRHPSQLYEAGLEGILLFYLLWSFSKTPKPRGATAGLFSLSYAIIRIFLEFFREPTLEFIAWGWLTMGQLLSFPMLIAGAILIYKAYYYSNNYPIPIKS